MILLITKGNGNNILSVSVQIYESRSEGNEAINRINKEAHKPYWKYAQEIDEGDSITYNELFFPFDQDKYMSIRYRMAKGVHNSNYEKIKVIDTYRTLKLYGFSANGAYVTRMLILQEDNKYKILVIDAPHYFSIFNRNDFNTIYNFLTKNLNKNDTK